MTMTKMIHGCAVTRIVRWMVMVAMVVLTARMVQFPTVVAVAVLAEIVELKVARRVNTKALLCSVPVLRVDVIARTAKNSLRPGSDQSNPAINNSSNSRSNLTPIPSRQLSRNHSVAVQKEHRQVNQLLPLTLMTRTPRRKRLVQRDLRLHHHQALVAEVAVKRIANASVTANAAITRRRPRAKKAVRLWVDEDAVGLNNEPFIFRLSRN
jgi:hypothetical protein